MRLALHSFTDPLAANLRGLEVLARQPSLRRVLNKESVIASSLSISVALARGGESIDGLIAGADQAMDRAKQAGRHQVITIKAATPDAARGILTRSHDTSHENGAGSAPGG